MEGVKYDQDKPRWELLPLSPTEEIVKVLTYGANKYDDDNWKKLKNLRDRYFAALMRHTVAYRQGEAYDPESGLHHLAHACCSLLFIMEFDRLEAMKPEGEADCDTCAKRDPTGYCPIRKVRTWGRSYEDCEDWERKQWTSADQLNG